MAFGCTCSFLLVCCTLVLISVHVAKVDCLDKNNSERSSTRVQRKSPQQPQERSMSAVRKRLQEEKKREQAMAVYASAHLDANGTTTLVEKRVETEQQQEKNRKLDKIHELHKSYMEERLAVVRTSRTDCDFESKCRWTWRRDIEDGFFEASGDTIQDNATGPRVDADNKKIGNFLILRMPSTTSQEILLTSPSFTGTKHACKFQFSVYQENMNGAEIRIVGDKIINHSQALSNHTQWVLGVIPGGNSKSWQDHILNVGQISDNFTLIVEVVPSKSATRGATVAFDNLALVHCYNKVDETCTAHQYHCKKSPNMTKVCINTTSICDITKDCYLGDDELQNCDRMPLGARCSFDESMCGWRNVPGKVLKWEVYSGPRQTNYTGPNGDHTNPNGTGRFLGVKMLHPDAAFASDASVHSVVFNPPPKVHGNISSQYYNSCAIRFYLYKYGKHKSGLLIQVTELRPGENVSTDLFWKYGDFGEQWIRHVLILPNITNRYYIQFGAKRGYRYMSDLAIDDVSLSPECFGLNIPPEELGAYDYWNPFKESTIDKETHQDFLNETYYVIKTCNATGRFGPTHSNCIKSYNQTEVSVKVMNEPGLSGVQRWTPPSDGFYTFILSGASGGKGSRATGSSRGAMVRVVLELRKGQEIFILVGQEGTSACVKTLGDQGTNTSCLSGQNFPQTNSIRAVLKMDIIDGGGGGGGGTFLFLRTKQMLIPLAVASGGGGLGLGRMFDTGRQHGQAINTSKAPVTGTMYSKRSAGAGGGWKMYSGIVDPAHKQVMGRALTDGGAIGGKACYNSTDNRGDGGFGGGGGGCVYGGGGGGFAGGDANATDGEGGYSYIDPTRTIPNLSEAHSGYNGGAGSVKIVPAIPGCGCNYRCVALDEQRSKTVCICPKNWTLNTDGKTCITTSETIAGEPYPPWFVIVLIATVIFLTTLVAIICFILYNRYQHRTTGLLRRKMLSGADLQLDRLRMTSDSMMTEYNPNYEFGGVVYTLKDLNDIPREQLRLVKALGQGAFGEVYQGFYRQRPCDTVEMPVAVKTLPEMSTSQAEMDFLMEALIMSKFNHPNIVHFIGVCFDKHPRFIVLELLAGGDLKNFLRESRPKPERSSPLGMKDLVLIAMDVAKGCRYLEENRFIHRDIAARNCLLTTKGPGRVVKIADFGMSRDVYRSDYYRKGGKAMLPIKWMPPEAFLDGIFTSKTDVWSFGVLLWEIMSMGYMPYTGCANREVMHLVTSGGRLDPPANCPGPIYGIMTQCWHPKPEERPTFATIMERLGYCVQDPQVMGAPLPVFHRPPSNERDTTVMRPLSSDENCLQVVPQSSEYLVPNNHAHSPRALGSTSSSVEQLLPVDSSASWETSFIMPQSKSTQPLLLDCENSNGQQGDSKTSTTTTTLEDNASPILLPNNVVGNHNNNVSSLKSGISLDPGALSKQNNKYANYGDGVVTGNGIIQNGPTA